MAINKPPEDYNGLMDQYKNLQNELDNKKQQLYDSSRQLKLAESLLLEYQSEIEVLQNDKILENGKWEMKIRSLEDTIVNIRMNHSQTISSAEVELEKKQKENADLQSEIELLRKKDIPCNRVSNSINFEEIKQLRDENDLLKDNYNCLNEAFQALQSRQVGLENELDEYRNEIIQLKETLEVKRETLLENDILIGKLNDDLFCLNKELENYKNKPLKEDSKGNSLFAEVDDRRVYLQKTISEMKSNYTQMKQEQSQHLKQISHLRKENIDLQNMWKKDLEQFEEDKQMLVASLNSHIKVLQEIIEKQKNELEMKPISSTVALSNEYQFYQEMIDSKHKEVKDLEEKLSIKCVGEYLLANSLSKANNEIRQLKLKIMELEQKLEEQKDLIKNKLAKENQPCKCTLEIKKCNSPPTDIKRVPLKSCMKARDNSTKNVSTASVALTSTDDKTKVIHNFEIFDENSETGAAFDDFKVKTSPKTNCYLDDVQKISKIALCDNKENIELNTTKKEVTFTSDTVDITSSRIQRRPTRVFIIPKKENADHCAENI